MSVARLMSKLSNVESNCQTKIRKTNGVSIREYVNTC